MPMNKPITTWNDEDKPREKLLAKGKSNLSDAELLAILIGSGTPKVTAVELCSQILEYVNNDLSQLGKLAVKDLMKFKGISYVAHFFRFQKVATRVATF